VVSGINRGLNVGDDLTYSGTVAGALEGALLHVPALAFSAATDERGAADYTRAAAFARRLCIEVLERGLPPGVLLNVNVPAGVPRGVRVTRQGKRTYRATVDERRDPSGRPYYWIAGADTTPSGEADGDHRAIEDGYVSVTPLHADLTHAPSLEELARWLLEVP
jgi:5'-nucleotidase